MKDISSKENGHSLPTLPQGWVWTNLKEASLKLQSGGTPSTKVMGYYENGTIPFVKIEDMVNSQKYLTSTITKITQAGLENSAAWLVPKKSLLYSMYASYGVPIITKIDVATNQAIIAFISDDALINTDFIFYYLLYIKPTLKRNIRGTTQENLNANIVSNLPTALAPYREQYRIVTKIEELFTQLDAGVASLKKVQAQLKRYRQAVLKAAFEGKFTQEWREGKKPSMSVQVLLEKISSERKKIIEKSGKKVKLVQLISDEESAQLPSLPTEWTWVRLDALSSMITDGKHGDCQDEDNSGFFFLSAKDVKNGKLHYDEARQIKKEDFIEVYNRTTLEYGDVVITNSGTIGRVAVIEKTPLTQHTCFQKSVAIIKPVKEFFNSRYLAFYLMDSIISIEKKSKGTAQKNLLIRDIKDLIIAFPSLEEQNAIVTEIERFFSQIDHLSQIISTSLQQSESLRQSILKRAFEGKLVPQDPNDEPASILLERIKTEKTNYAAEAKKGKTLQPKSPKRKIRNAN